MAQATEKELIQAALAQLDPTNDEQWTNDGLPRVEAVDALLGVTGTKRNAITDADPTFNRATALELKAAAEAAQGDAPTEGGDQDSPIADDAGDDAQGDLDETVEDDDDPMAALDKAVAAAEAVLEKARAVENEARREVAAAVAERDKLIEAREKNRPIHENQLAIQRHLESQGRLREERAQRAAAARAAVSGLDLSGKSGLDAAMARKNTRGAQRPAPRPPAPTE